MPDIKMAERVRPLIERGSTHPNGVTDLDWMSYRRNPLLLRARSFINSTAGNWNANTLPDVKVAERIKPLIESSTNLQVYQQHCHPIVESVMLDFNGTIFAFGQRRLGSFKP
ncbi:hypothetical protein MRX96_040774 [Rhipicephalus microplus]